MRKVLRWSLFTFSNEFLLVNIQIRDAYPNWVLSDEFANNFVCSSVKNILILRNA